MYYNSTILSEATPIRAGTILTALLAVLWSCESSPTNPIQSSGGLTNSHVVEALFLGTGPALDGAISSACVLGGRDVWYGYERGVPVRVVLGPSVGAADRPAIFDLVDQMTEATNGLLAVEVVETNVANPQPGPNEITMIEVDQQTQTELCGFQGTACFKCASSQLPRLDTCRIFVRNDLQFSPGTVHNHELGHALGFCHIAGSALQTALMGSPQLGSSNVWTGPELEAIASVYLSELELGATKADFIAAGLVDLTGKD